MSAFSTKEIFKSSVRHHANYLCFMRSMATCPAFASGASGLVVVLTPPGEPSREYVSCATAFLYEGLETSDYEEVGYFQVTAKDKPEKIKSEFEAACTRKSRVIVISEITNLPAIILVAADATAQMEPFTGADLREACRNALNLSVTVKQADELMTYPRDVMISSLQRGRPASESLRRLRRVGRGSITGGPIMEPVPRLEELHGYGEAKEWGLQLASDLKLWKSGKLRWSDVDRGLLLSGPPGVGKTIFAKALAATCDVHFIATSVSQWQAQGNLADLLKSMKADFEIATKKAPSIIFLDELDSIGSRERFSGDYAAYSIQVVNGLLECLDGSTIRNGLVVIGATNHPEKIDPAVRRPGRLDRHVVIGLPDEVDRLAILGTLLGDDQSFDLRALGPPTEGMAGADLAQVVRDGRRVARREGRDLGLSDLTSQLPQMLQVVGAYRHSVALHEAGHILVGVALSYGKFQGAMIRGQVNPQLSVQSAGGAFFEFPRLLVRNERHYRDDICVRLSGIAAEKLIIGGHGDGAGAGIGSDLAVATSVALEMETKFGMGGRLSQLGRGTCWDDFGPYHVAGLGDRVETTLREEMKRSAEIIEKQRPLLLRLALELEEFGVISPARLTDLQIEVAEKKQAFAPSPSKGSVKPGSKIRGVRS
jgi:cell division protease FtsH